MPSFHRFRYQSISHYSFVCWLLCTSAAPMATAATPIVVNLQNGSRLSAELDHRTDDKCLWLRWTVGMSSVRRPIAWDRVESAQLSGESADREQLQQAAKQADARPQPLLRAAPPPQILDTAPRIDAMNGNLVRSLDLFAALGYWDADVPSDGIVLVVRPLAEDGFVIPVNGRLAVELLAPPYRVGSSGRPIRSLGRWNLAVRPEHFGPSGARYRLAFQGVHPEFDLNVSPMALLHVRLVVPGMGHFEASQSNLRVRPYSAIRDRLQQQTGRRFLSREQSSAR